MREVRTWEGRRKFIYASKELNERSSNLGRKTYRASHTRKMKSLNSQI